MLSVDIAVMKQLKNVFVLLLILIDYHDNRCLALHFFLKKNFYNYFLMMIYFIINDSQIMSFIFFILV